MMKKIIQQVLKVLAWIVGVLIGLLIILGIINSIMTYAESKSVNSAYGQFVEINGGKVHVSVQGTGKKVVVLLPGLGVAAPGIDFKPLVNELKKDYTVVVYEGFGYGPSDDTAKPRTTDNIVAEIHQTLAKLGYQKYSLIAHSISGVYALKYTLTYNNEVEAVVGIDSSVPDQNKLMPENLQKQLPNMSVLTGLFRFAGWAGIIRAYVTIAPNATTAYDRSGYELTGHEKDIINKLTIRNLASNAVLDEMVRSDNDSGGLTANTKYPSETPVKFFLSDQSLDLFPAWKDIHIAQLANPTNTSVVMLNGDHFLYHTQAATIANGLRSLVIPATD